MEELPVAVKIIGVLICVGSVVLLATYDKLEKRFKRSPSRPKSK
jgi:hypothetical protein